MAQQNYRDPIKDASKRHTNGKEGSSADACMSRAGGAASTLAEFSHINKRKLHGVSTEERKWTSSVGAQASIIDRPTGSTAEAACGMKADEAKIGRGIAL